MARMVFGNWASSEPAAPKAAHFVPAKLSGTKTACGRVWNGRMDAWKDWKMVTCQQCRAHRPKGVA